MPKQQVRKPEDTARRHSYAPLCQLPPTAEALYGRIGREALAGIATQRVPGL